jgi:putative oligomerization/nucleic acid binding protein/PH (Pleckstrin Homology) domain-containing protein
MSESREIQDPTADVAPVDETAQFQSLLASGERVLVVRQRHWFTFVDAARWFILVLAAGVLVGAINGEVPDDGIVGSISTVLNWGFLLFVGAGLVGIGWYYLAWRRERYLVTTRRVIEAGGVINKYSRDTTLSMITDMVVGHPWVGRLVGYGEIDLLTASEAGTNKIRFLPHADEFKRALLDAKYEHEMEVGGGYATQGAVAAGPVPAAAPVHAAAAPPAQAAAAADRLSAEEVDASITRLADLRERGLITEAEFEEKKREILRRL